MSKLRGAIIALLVVFLAGGWYLGQVQSELMETQMNLVADQNSITALKNQLAARDSELLSIKTQLEEARHHTAETQPRHFSSLEELKTWLARDNTNESQYSPSNFNCVDFALMLQKHALVDGYILSTEVLPVGAHWVNVAVISDSAYFIEPQDDSIILEKKVSHDG